MALFYTYLGHRPNPPRPLDNEFIEFFGRMESVLRVVLRRFERKFGSSFPLIDELIECEAPTSEDAKRLKQEVPNTLVTYYRFFDGIPDGRWLDPLQEEGFFSHPPGPEIEGGEGRETGYPPWPQSRYLARIAPDEPDRVKDVYLGLPATGNIRVYEDVARAAREMPADQAAELAPRVKEGLDSRYFSALALEGGRLVSHLAANGQPEAALDLSTDLLALVPDRVEEPDEESEESSALLAAIREPRPRFLPAEYYAEVLDTCVEPLADGAGTRAVGMLCGLLSGALRVRLSLDDGEDDVSLPYEDRLYMDRPAIEDHRYNRERGLNEGYTGSLLAAVRDAAERLCERDPEKVSRLVALLEARGGETFDRLALHLLGLYPEAPGARDLVAERLNAGASTATPGLFHEYALLLREWFPSLGPGEKDSILEAIRQGPSPEELEEVRERQAERFEEPDAAAAAEEYLSQYGERWRYKRLAILGDLLPDGVHAEYERLAETYADPGGNPLFHDEPRVRALTSESPKSAGELAEMDIADVASFLREFEPGDGWDKPDERDVGRELRRAAASQPGRFSAGAELFEKVGLTYAGEVLGGLNDAFRARRAGNGETDGQLMEWHPLLRLCRGILEQGGPVEGEEQAAGSDVGSLLSTKQAAMLLRDGLLERGEVPFELQEEVWAVIEKIMAHPEPTTAYEEEQLQRGRPPISPNHLSINTVRGVAAHATLSYVLWVRRNLDRDSQDGHDDAASDTDGEDHDGFGWRSLQDCLEASEVLERYLDPAVEPTRTVRSVYGTWLPTLVALDREWVRVNLPRIFPVDPSLSHLEEAAWETYVVGSRVYDEVFNLLRVEYRRAVERLDGRAAELGPHSPATALAEHLMSLYWRGKLNFGDHDGLLERFYELAPDELRGWAAGYVGRVLRNTEPSPDAATLLEDLWERRLQAAQQTVEIVGEGEEPAEQLPGERNEFSEELGAFGWWLVSDRLDSAGTLERMERGLALGGDVGQDAFTVAQGLAELSAEQPLLAVQCLRHIIRQILEGGTGAQWQILSIEDSALAVMRAALGNVDREASQIAAELANRLVASGYRGFEPLLDGQ